MNYKAHLEALRSARDGWLEILSKNPDSVEAAGKIVTINSQIQYIQSMKWLSGDYED
jgi:hypothetical protein